MAQLEPWLDGFAFLEGPRWHDGRLWFSDMHAQRVYAASEDGALEAIARVPACPSGLGWLPDGRLLVVSMEDRRLLRREADGSLVTHADLSGIATFHCNDMVVDAVGRAYVGNFGYDLHTQQKPRPATLALVLTLIMHVIVLGSVLLVPVLMGAVRATTQLLQDGSLPWPPVQLLLVADGVYLIVSFLSFEYVLDE